MAVEMQRLLNAKLAPTAPADRPALYKDCLESFYTADQSTSDEDVMNKNLATDEWYAKKSKYNFETGERSSPEAEEFTRMVWRITDGKVAFARNGKYVMAWYCPGGSSGINSGDQDAFKSAVNPDTCTEGKECEDDVPGMGYRKCYQKDALDAHNDKREQHKVPDLTTDIDVARQAQKLAKELSEKDIGDGTASITLDDEWKQKCSMNYIIADDSTQALDKDWATQRWYDKGQAYMYFQDKKYDPTPAPFVNMIWRSTTRVGFGVDGKAVVALYCPGGNIRGGFECNVCPKPGGCDESVCPEPDAICSATDGEGHSEISLNEDEESIRIIAWVKKGQIY
jgi:hypothetical protein